MNLYKNYLGEIVNLENPDNYPVPWDELSVQELYLKAIDLVGRSIVFMDYIHPDWDNEQWLRVDALARELFGMDGEKRYLEIPRDRKILYNWLYRFEDEIENQC